MLASVAMLQQPYVSRPEAEAFLAAFDTALKAPADNPVVFHVWGIGGIGKSTLLRELIKTFSHAAIPLISNLPISFGQTEGIDTPIELMEKMHDLLEPQFLNPNFFRRGLRSSPDPFKERYTEYFEAIHQLQSTSSDGNSGASAEQIGLVKQLLKGLVQVGGAWATVTGNPVIGGALTAASKGTDAVVDSASLALSERDRIQSLIASHKATREKRDLQKLLLNPLPILTQAFVESLSQWSAQKPIVLVLDTYEKAELATIDTWLWRTLLSNTNIRKYPIRLVIAGRYNLLKRQDWATVQQNTDLVKPYGPEEFTPDQTQEYLAKIHITDPATVGRICQVTKGWPYYLNKIREAQQTVDPSLLTQDLATFLVNHLSPTEQAMGKRIAQIAACCRWFDVRLIEFLAQQFQLLSPLRRNNASPAQFNCFAWLKEQTFVEPVTSGCFRLDDVARDVFRASFWQEDQPNSKRTHDLLARYFKAQSDQKVPASTPTSEKYENSDWLEPRAEYLYHLLFTQQTNLQTIWLSHLLEAIYLRQTHLVQGPLQAVLSEYELSEHLYLSHTNRRFLETIRPAIEHSWAVLEEDPLDYRYNEANFGLTQKAIDRAAAVCLESTDQFRGLAQFVAPFYRARRCAKPQKISWLEKARIQADALVSIESPEFMAELFLFRLGTSFYVAGALKEAIACCDQAWAIKPDDHEALNSKGGALDALGHKEAAIACYDEALQIKPDKHEALNNKGVALDALGHKEAAIACYDEALQIKPDKHEALNNKGVALDALGYKEAAIACYDEALQIKPDKHEVLYNKGSALDALGRYEEALDAWNKSLEFNPTDSDAWNWRGVMLMRLERREDAVTSYEKAIELDPRNFWPWKNLGKILDQLGNYSKAIANYEKALEIRPKNSDVWESLGLSQLHAEQYLLAIESFNKAIELDSENDSPVYNKACCSALQGDADNAVKTLQAAIALDPENRDMAKTDTDFDPIRDDPRFQTLLEEM